MRWRAFIVTDKDNKQLYNKNLFISVRFEFSWTKINKINDLRKKERKYLDGSEKNSTFAPAKQKRYAPLAQLVEHLTLNQGVQGSSP